MQKNLLALLMALALLLPPSFVSIARNTAPALYGITETVYICNGKYATKYHKKEDCRGLNNCKSTVSSLSKTDAEKKGRTSCDTCYP